MKDKKQVRALLILAVVIAALFFILPSFFVPRDDVGFCRYILDGMANNRSTVEKYIDWGVLKAGDTDVGKTYSGYITPKEKEMYKKIFLVSFSGSFKMTGAKMSDFSNWRLYDQDSQKTTVAVTGKGGTVYLTISNPKYGHKKLINLQWKEKEPSQP